MLRRLAYLSLSLGFALSAAAQEEPRIALVIGNANYAKPAWVLENPVRDASLIAEKLAALDFEVILRTDLGEDGMEDAFAEFGAALEAAGPQAVGLFYYAGHGVASEGDNYLIPVDARPETERDVWRQAPHLGEALRHMRRAGNDVNFVILDACRNSPLPRDDAKRDLGGGLTDIEDARGMLIAYATEPGFTAADDTGMGHSPYTSALANFIDQPGLAAELMFKRVASVVVKTTGGGQIPFFNSGLTGSDFYFAGNLSIDGLRLRSEMTAYAEAEEDGDPCAFVEFVRTYPNSTLRKSATRKAQPCKTDSLDQAAAAAQRPDADFGDADGREAGDGLCADRRFTGIGMSPPPWSPLDVRNDMTDCRDQWRAGRIDWRTPSTLGIAAITGPHEGIDFGTDGGSWANDGQCDDVRFAGPGMAPPSVLRDARSDRSDCLVAYLADRVVYDPSGGG